MAQNAAFGDYETGTIKPPLSMDVRLRLSVMMFLQFAVWGSWFMVFGNYLGASVAAGGLGFNGSQIGSLYGTMALGAMLSMMVAGQLADRLMPSQYLLAIFHIVGAALLYRMTQVHDYTQLWWITFAYALTYNPTLALCNSLSFANVPDATRDFPTLRVLGTIGWIAANLSVDVILPKGSATTARPLMMAAVVAAALGVFCVLLPHTPPSGKKGGALPFLRAFRLLGDRSFGIFFVTSLVITIALAFYFTFAGTFIQSVGVKNISSTMSFGQMSEIGFMLLLPFALKRFGMKWVLVMGMAAWAVRYALFSFGALRSLYFPILLGVILHGVCFDFFLAAGFIHTENKAPGSIRGSAQALFSFLTYGVGMWIGNVVSGQIVDHYTFNGVQRWSSIWLVPTIGAAVCLVLFMLFWRDRPGKLSDEVEDARGFPIEPVAITPATAGAE